MPSTVPDDDDIAILHRSQWQGVDHLVIGDEFDRLAFKHTERRETTTKDHVRIVGGINGAGWNKSS